MTIRKTLAVIVLFTCLLAVGWAMSNLRPHRHFQHHSFNLSAYFSDVLIDVNFEPRLVPRPLTAEMMASEMPAAINPYSMAVAAVSSRQKRFTSCIVQSRPIHESLLDFERGVLSRLRTN